MVRISDFSGVDARSAGFIPHWSLDISAKTCQGNQASKPGVGARGCECLAIAVQADPNPPMARIEGQIYVTRKDRETIKMSLVTVRIVESGAVRAVLEKARERQIQARLAVARDEDWRERSKALADALPGMKPADAAKARQTMAALRTLVISNTPSVRPSIAKADQSDLLRLIDWPSSKTLQTDADGAFTAEMPPGRWTLVAWAERTLIKEEEKYLWIVPALTGERTLLNNSNLFTEDAR